MGAAEMAREEALNRVSANSDITWRNAAKWAIWNLAVTGEPFTTDDLWATLDVPHEKRALGALMKEAERKGIIKPTGDWKISKRAECHARPLREWIAGPRAVGAMKQDRLFEPKMSGTAEVVS